MRAAAELSIFSRKIELAEKRGQYASVHACSLCVANRNMHLAGQTPGRPVRATAGRLRSMHSHDDMHQGVRVVVTGGLVPERATLLMARAAQKTHMHSTQRVLTKEVHRAGGSSLAWVRRSTGRRDGGITPRQARVAAANADSHVRPVHTT